MNNIDKLKKVVDVNCILINPRKLEELARGKKNSDKFPNLKSSFEFPPKPIEFVIQLFLDNDYEKLNFFDITRLLTYLENDDLKNKVSNKLLFSHCLQELFDKSEKYIQNLILKVVTKIFLKNNNSYIFSLENNLKSKEFVFIQHCLKREFKWIQNRFKNRSLKKVLKFYGLHKILSNSITEYSIYLLKKITQIHLTKDTIDTYKNNLLIEDDLEVLYFQTKELVSIIADKKNPKNASYIDEILITKLGNIENSESKWQTLVIPFDIQEKYKRLKGLFEFQRFVDIANYLAEHTDLSHSNLSTNGKTSDATRIISRSDFWSNYDERFSSVKMWVNENDYKILEREKIVDLSDIKILKNIDNEACMLEFKESNLLITEFFRQRDNNISRKSLIFEDDNVQEVKEMLNSYNFSNDLYDELQRLASFKINHDFLWQGWVDKFLRDKNIYPNDSILNGKKFQSFKKVIYTKAIGLQSARSDALNNERKIEYSDVIWKL